MHGLFGINSARIKRSLAPWVDDAFLFFFPLPSQCQVANHAIILIPRELEGLSRFSACVYTRLLLCFLMDPNGISGTKRNAISFYGGTGISRGVYYTVPVPKTVVKLRYNAPLDNKLEEQTRRARRCTRTFLVLPFTSDSHASYFSLIAEWKIPLSVEYILLNRGSTNDR